MPPHSLSTTIRLIAIAFILTVPLVPARADDQSQVVTNVTVSVGKIVRTTLHAYVVGYGSVETAPVDGADQPAGGTRLFAAAPGVIVAVPGVAGAHVEKGAVIVQLDARAADAAVARAQAAATAAEGTVARQAQLQAVGGTSERAVQDAKALLAAAKADLTIAQVQQSQLAIRAPLSGTISFLQATPGEWLDAGKEVAEIVNLDRLVVAAQIPSSEAGALSPGQSAEIMVRLGTDDKPLAEGAVQFVSPQVSADNGSVLVHVSVPPASGLRPGQLVAVRIATETRANCLAVPLESLVKDPDAGYVISVVEGDKAKQKPVQPGLRDGGLVEITGEGLAEGAEVVTEGAYDLPKETKITVRKP